MHFISKYIIVFTFLTGLFSCKKLIEIDAPIDTITTDQVFETNAQAEWTVSGIYSRMINGDQVGTVPTYDFFYAGLANIAASLSSDDLVSRDGEALVNTYVLNANVLNTRNAMLTTKIWNSAYKTIYDANAAIEGIAASTSIKLNDSVRRQLTGEAKALRAFAYFYLTNFFGDLPLALTIDFQRTKNISRSPQSKIYEQIITDLTDAKDMVADDFSVGNDMNERIRINKWFVEAFLARVYLYTGKYHEAINSASTVINKTDFFGLEPDLNTVFKRNSREAIWQLAQADGYAGTPEGHALLPGFGAPAFIYSEEFLNLFTADDKRKQSWILPSQFDPNNPIDYSPYKYKLRWEPGAAEEYYTVMRLAELYLIRAEANILLSANNTAPAIEDLNAIRERAGTTLLPLTLTAEEVIDAVALERRMELFTEGAHRWFDLKRTGKASAILSEIQYKQPWQGDYQLLYPIPSKEIEVNSALTQNPQYDNF